MVLQKEKEYFTIPVLYSSFSNHYPVFLSSIIYPISTIYFLYHIPLSYFLQSNLSILYPLDTMPYHLFSIIFLYFIFTIHYLLYILDSLFTFPFHISSLFLYTYTLSFIVSTYLVSTFSSITNSLSEYFIHDILNYISYLMDSIFYALSFIFHSFI